MSGIRRPVGFAASPPERGRKRPEPASTDRLPSATMTRPRDNLYGGSGTDDLSGGDGDDHAYGEDGDDAVVGGEGDDYLQGGEGNDTVTGQPRSLRPANGV